MDLSSFYLDTSAAYFMEYDFGDNTIKWSRGGALLPEAGVLRVEYILLFIGLIGFIFRAVEAANNERKEIVRYITIMSSHGHFFSFAAKSLKYYCHIFSFFKQK